MGDNIQGLGLFDDSKGFNPDKDVAYRKF